MFSVFPFSRFLSNNMQFTNCTTRKPLFHDSYDSCVYETCTKQRGSPKLHSLEFACFPDMSSSSLSRPSSLKYSAGKIRIKPARQRFLTLNACVSVSFSIVPFNNLLVNV